MSVTVDSNPSQASSANKLLTRVVNYPIVSKAWDSARVYYQTAKDSSSIVRYGCQAVETNLEKSVKLMEPVLQNPVLKSYSEPILEKASDFGCRQLDNIEVITDKLVKKGTELSETYQSSKNMIENKIQAISHDVKATTWTLAEMGVTTLDQKVVPPVDNFLQASVIGVPITMAVSVTEKVAGRWIPEVATPEKETENVGPVRRAGNLSLKLQKQLVNMTLRTAEKRGSMLHVVDLIHYAKTHLDNGVKTTNTFLTNSVSKGMELTTATASAVYSKQQEGVKEVSRKIRKVAHDTLVILQHAVEALSTQVPAPVASLSHTAIDSLKEKTKQVGNRLDSIKDIAAFQLVASKAVSSLEETHTLLSSYVQNHPSQAVPVQLVNNVAATVDHVVESLLALLKRKSNTSEADRSLEPEDDEEEEESVLVRERPVHREDQEHVKQP